MISIIISARNPVPQSPLERNIRKTVGAAHELLMINNSSGQASLASVYNFALSRARGEILVFMHDDLLFMKPGWGVVLESKFSQYTGLGIVGITGTQYLYADNHSWTAPGHPFLKGQLVHNLQNGDFFATLFSTEKGDFDVVCCTGIFMAVRREVFVSARFDEETFDGFFFHDIDLCMQARKSWKIMVTTDILAKHRSTGTFGKEWQFYGSHFLLKHSSSLPASCSGQVPNPSGANVPIKCVNLKGKVSQETIA